MLRNAIAIGALTLVLAGCQGALHDVTGTGKNSRAGAAVAEAPPGPGRMTMLDLEPSTSLPPTPLPKPKPPLRHDEVIELQAALQHFGYDPGPIDGYLGPRTLAAVRAYQVATGLPVGGGVTYALLLRLRGQVKADEAAHDGKHDIQAAPNVEPAAGKTSEQKPPPQQQKDQGVFRRFFGPLFGK